MHSLIDILKYLFNYTHLWFI